MKSYRRTDPRSIRGAKRRGWPTLSVPKNYIEKNNVSWVGIMLWCDSKLKGRYVQDFQTHRFSFELQEDASWFAMKWCV